MTNSKVRSVVAENSVLQPEDIDGKTRLDELGIDSLEFMEMMLQLQSECGVEFSDVEIARMQTVEDLEKAVDACRV